MKIEEIGRLIYTLRTREHISQDELCRGICSKSTLSRMETGERCPDIFTFNALFQRLGKSADYVNIVITLKEFEYIVKRRNVEISILTEKFDQAKEELDQMKTELKAKRLTLQRQEMYRLYALLSLYEDNNYSQAEQYVYQALLETYPDFDIEEIFPKYLSSNLRFSKTELQLLLLYCHIKEHLDELEPDFLDDIIRYVKLKITDKKAQNGELPQALCLRAHLYKKEQLWKKCFNCCEDMIEAEIQTGGLFILSQALEMEMECLEHNIVTDNGELRRKQYEHLKFVLETYGKEIPKRKEFSFFLESTAQEKSLIDEVLRFSRSRIGYSQEKLSEGICTPETFSRIETGKRKPSVKNFYAIMQKTGLNIGYYNTEFVVEHFETLEKIGELKRLNILKHFEQAEEQLKKIESEIDMSITQNQQRIALYHTVFDYRLGRIAIEKALEQTEQILELTRKRKRKTNMFDLQCPPTFTEISLLNQIAVYYRNMGKQEQAVEILLPLYEYLHQSKLEAPERSQKYFMVISNLSTYLEELGNLEKALELLEESLKAAIKYNIGLRMGSNLIEKAYIQEKLNNKDCLKTYEHGYYLCGLFGNFVDQNKVKQHILKNWEITYNH